MDANKKRQREAVDISDAVIDFGGPSTSLSTSAPVVTTSSSLSKKPQTASSVAAGPSSIVDPFIARRMATSHTAAASEQQQPHNNKPAGRLFQRSVSIFGGAKQPAPPSAGKQTQGGGGCGGDYDASKASLAANAAAASSAANAAMTSLLEAPIIESGYERALNFEATLRHAQAQRPPMWMDVVGGGLLDVADWDIPFLEPSEAPRYAFAPPPPPSSSSSSSAAVWAAATVSNVRQGAFHNLLHHPPIPLHPCVRDELAWEGDADNQCVKMAKTKDEIRAERRRIAQEKREESERQQAKQKLTASRTVGGVAAASSSSTAGRNASLLSFAQHDTLRWKSLTNQHVAKQLALDPQGVHDAIERQYEERFEKHQLMNYQRHVEAIPRQMEKREADMWRHAEENPRLHAYRVPKARNADCINRLRNFANDVKLRGVLVWIAEEDLVVVLVGGEVAMRHLDRWICEKMEWHRLPKTENNNNSTAAAAAAASGFPSSEGKDEDYNAAKMNKVRRVDPSLLEKTRGRLVASVKLMRVGDVSFLLPKKSIAQIQAVRRQGRQEETVFVRSAATVEDAASFICNDLPAGGVFSSLDFVWSAAYYSHLR